MVPVPSEVAGEGTDPSAVPPPFHQHDAYRRERPLHAPVTAPPGGTGNYEDSPPLTGTLSVWMLLWPASPPCRPASPSIVREDPIWTLRGFVASDFGKVRVNMPFSKVALAASAFTWIGRVNERWNRPLQISW